MELQIEDFWLKNKLASIQNDDELDKNPLFAAFF